MRFSCQPGCTRCCTQKGWVYLSVEDVPRLAAFLGMSAGRISAAVCLCHEAYPPSAYASTRTLPIPEGGGMFRASRQAHAMPSVSFLARVDRRQEGTESNGPVVSRDRTGRCGAGQDTGRERTGNAESVSTHVLRAAPANVYSRLPVSGPAARPFECRYGKRNGAHTETLSPIVAGQVLHSAAYYVYGRTRSLVGRSVRNDRCCRENGALAPAVFSALPPSSAARR